jgi:spore germination protein GerM
LRTYANGTTLADLRSRLPWFNQPLVTLYFMDESGTFFVPVTRPVSAHEELWHTAVTELRRGPKPGSPLRNVVPNDLVVSALAVHNGIAHLDLAGSAITRLDAETATHAAMALQQTLLALPTVMQVEITVAGHPLFTALDNVSSVPGQRGDLLYYVADNYLVAVPFPSNPDQQNTTLAALRQIALAYLQGAPTASRLVGLPPQTELLELTFNEENGLAYVNLRYTQAVRELAIAEPEQMRLVLTGLIYTLTAVPGVKAVMLDFEGQRQLGLGQCRSLLRTPQLRPEILNDERLMP